ncbi:TetR family transcriptional regulator [Microtetraspora sp. NBRC 13810]|uniref:TetR/AcrR family transcriptional regulator n=1 Tax=Microtetraspora sp. NBRC 13810 TaxID=3030990 RepID=UPI0024A4AE5B|nr:TetR/AcrR family transcriptional regulator [Microtetraspora sp. NBRC 13810]GLW08626.1 TetR family transcriptional regulator [Microtetraspora sp. NBRC 13810]
MNASRTARERVRAELTREITDIARRHLATDGAPGLSLRAVAREMGMVSSAIYRYFPSRDDLLTALIIDGYNALGEAVEQADAGCPRADHAGRWRAVCRAVREWALAHPHEYALLYGSPVPGYQAPQDTIGPAMRDTLVYGRIIAEAHEAGVLDPPAVFPPPPASFAEDAVRLRAVIPGVPDDVIARAVMAWTGLFGMVNFELFGQFNNAILDPATLFDHNMTALGRVLGLP